MENWDEIRTAYQVALHGTVSAAALALGVHHATVIRHVDALESRLGVKLFQRHSRGYTPTEAGRDLLQVAEATDDQFSQLAGRIKGQGAGVSGEIVVTSLALAARRLVPMLADFQVAYPEVRLRYRTGDRLFRLEYGEAHVAIRAGAKPQEPDNVVQPFVQQEIALVGAADYVARQGLPADGGDLGAHQFVLEDAATDGTGNGANATARAPFYRWLQGAVPAARVSFRASDGRDVLAAVRAGAGLGFVEAEALYDQPDLVEVIPRKAEWAVPLWLVTHVDLHRTSKVQALLGFLKSQIKAEARAGGAS